MIRALLIDLDGTLVDTHAANLAAYRQAIDTTGLHYSADELATFVGKLAWRPMLSRVLPNHPELHETIALRKREIYPQTMDLVRVNSGLLQAIQLLKGQLKLALVTAASRHSVETLLNAKQLINLFDLIITSDDVSKQKPDPQPYQVADERLGVAPAECLVFEDSDIGIAAARTFGAQIWQVHWTKTT